MNRANELQQGKEGDTIFGDIQAVVHKHKVAQLMEESEHALREHDRLNIIRESLGMPAVPLPTAPDAVPAEKLVVNNIPLKYITLPGKSNKVFVAPGHCPGQSTAWRHEKTGERNLWFLGKQSVALNANST